MRTPIARLASTLALACVLFPACATTRDGGTESEVLAIAAAQQAAWNRGDVEGYMRAGYMRSPDLVFFSGGDDTRGYDPVLARYVARYASGDAEMGRLEFGALEARALGGDHALLRGRWHLDFERKEDVGGLFTLVLARTAEGWRIVHDHTSVAAPVAGERASGG